MSMQAYIEPFYL